MNRKHLGKTGFFHSISLGLIISVLTSLFIFMVPLTKSLTKVIIALIIGSCIGFLTSIILILYQKLNRIKIHDDLTGLYNQNFLNECKYRVIAQTDRQEGKMGLVIADIYRLENIIKVNGEKIKDEVFKYVGEGLSATSRATEFIFRLEDDNFLIFFSDINEYSNIQVIKSRLEKFFQKPLIYNNHTIEIKLNFGFAVYPEDGDNFEEVFSVAQQRMYVEQRR